MLGLLCKSSQSVFPRRPAALGPARGACSCGLPHAPSAPDAWPQPQRRFSSFSHPTCKYYRTSTPAPPSLRVPVVVCLLCRSSQSVCSSRRQESHMQRRRATGAGAGARGCGPHHPPVSRKSSARDESSFGCVVQTRQFFLIHCSTAQTWTVEKNLPRRARKAHNSRPGLV